MVMPGLYDIFFGNDFSDDVTPELQAAEKAFNTAMDKAEADFNIPFAAADTVRCANTNEHMMAQYTGFLQGFRFAVKILTGVEATTDVH